MSTKTAVETDVAVTTKIKPPSKYKVIFLNDDFTTFGFVVGVLTEYFRYDEESASQKTIEIDEQGNAVVAIYPFEIAEYKKEVVEQLAKQNGYPFKVVLEEE